MHAACQLVTMIKHSNESKACFLAHESSEGVFKCPVFLKPKPLPAKTRACTAAARHRTYSFAQQINKVNEASSLLSPKGTFLITNYTS